MMLKLAVPALALLLWGCASGDSAGVADSRMAQESEICRAAAASALDLRGVQNNQTASDKQAQFEGLYRRCMADKGYTLTPETL